MARYIHKNKDEELFKNLKILTSSQLNELFERDKFEYHVHLSKIPFHLLEEKNMLEKLSKQTIYMPDVIKRLSKKFKSDNSNIEILIKLLTHSHGNQGMRYMPTKRRNDSDFIETILKIYKEKKMESGWTYKYSSKYIKNNKKIALLAMETNANPDCLPRKFKSDLDIFNAYIRGKRAYAKKYKQNDLNLYGIKEFNLKKTYLNDELLKLLKVKAEPSVYKHLNYKNKCIKKNALISIYDDINTYVFLPKKLKKDIQIINYIISRNPDIVFENLAFEDYKNINFAKLNLSNKVRAYIFKKFERELYSRTTDILELAKYKANILNIPKAIIKENPVNNWHFSKPKVFKAIEKITTENVYLQREMGKKLLENISYELSRDMEILCHLSLHARLTLEDFNSSKLSKRSLAYINKNLFIKRKYRRVSTEPAILKGRIRKYITDRIIHSSCNNNSEVDYSICESDNFRYLTRKEKKYYIKKYPSIVKHYYYEDLCEYVKYLNKSQINDFIKEPENIRRCKYSMKKIFGNSYSKNITLAKSVIRDWPDELTCSVIDFNYLINHNNEFKKFLKNYNKVTIHEDNLRSLPAALKNNKLFIKKAIGGTINLDGPFRIYKELSSSFKTDPEITDWVLAIRPQNAKYLSVTEFKKLDTKNLHPIARKVIYDKYLKKSKTSDVLENALIKQKLLQLNSDNKVA